MTKTVDIDKLLTAYFENYRLSEASKAVGISDGCARKILKEANAYLTKEEADERRRQQLIDKITEFCKDGKKTYKEIAELLGLSVKSAQRIVKNLQLKKWVIDKKELDEKELKRRIKILKTMPNLTVPEMSRRTGIPASTIWHITRKYKIKYKQQNEIIKETICWTCANYCKCSWHKTFTQVKGWEAEKTFKAGGVSKINSYLVKKCPMYEKEEQTEGRKIIRDIYKKIDTLGKYKRICGKLRINQKCLDAIERECPLGIFKNMLNAEIEVDNSIKTFRVEGVNYERS